MSRSEQRKGVDGEAEVRRMYQLAGAEIKGLEYGGDWMAFGLGTPQHVEVKRQEIARPWQWYEKAAAEAVAGSMPVVPFRRSRSPWLALVPLGDLLDTLNRLVRENDNLRTERDSLAQRLARASEDERVVLRARSSAGAS